MVFVRSCLVFLVCGIINIPAIYAEELISLNFQDVSVRSALHMIADFSTLNIVASDAVQGNITLKLQSVTWQHALMTILQSKGLGQKKLGNIILVAPLNEMVGDANGSEILHTEVVSVKHAKAKDIIKLLQNESGSLLSSRGQLRADFRTNSLLIKDSPDKVDSLKKVLALLDVPVTQVMIETQIVEVQDITNNSFSLNLRSTNTKNIQKNMTMDFSGVDSKSLLNLNVAKLSSTVLLELELQAMEEERKGKVLARPKLMTLDKQTAFIETGTEIPIPITTKQGATPTVTFKKAVLKLEVTPFVTPEHKISMGLAVSKDTIGSIIAGNASVDTTKLKTHVLVNNGTTIVLGGIFQEDKFQYISKVPFLGDLPIIGNLFKSKDLRNSRKEILIFVTPKII